LLRGVRVETFAGNALSNRAAQTGEGSVLNVAHDIRNALRSLRFDRSAAVFSIAIVGLGIGASATVFSICQALLLRPLPFEEPDRLVWIANGTSENLSAQTVQVVNLVEFREQSRSLEGVAGFFQFYAPGDVRLTGGGEPERLTGVPVTQTFFPLLGVRPHAGRFFDESESRFNAPGTAVLDYRFWQRRFAGDRGIIGKSIVLDGKPVTVIGVLPASFDFEATFIPGRRVDLFFPFPLSPETNRQGNTLALVGRLRKGADLRAAQAEATLIASRFKPARVGDRSRNGFDPRLTTLRERVSRRFQSALLVLAGAVAFLMLLVCANVSNLLLVRASRRQREMAVRAALGATRGDLVRQMLAESLTVSVAGAGVGIIFVMAATALVSRLQGTTIPLVHDVRVDHMALGFTVVMAVVTGIVFGLVPAFQSSAQSLPIALAEASRGSTSRRGGRARRAIVVAEVALAYVLCAGAGLLIRSLGRVLDVQPGFATENLIAVRVDPSRVQSTFAQRTLYFEEALRAVRALPLGDNFGWRRWSASAGGGEPNADQGIQPLVRMINEGYLAAMKIPVRDGRTFTTADDSTSEPVIIINEMLARTLWPGKDPIGRIVSTSGRNRRVVGVVGDVRYFGLDRGVDAEMYMPIRQTGDYQSVDLVVRGAIPPAALAAGVRAALRRVDASLPVVEFRTMEELVDHSVFPRRFTVLLVAGFAAFGLMLSCLGLYAVISYSVSQRTQEIGIRMALGATPASLRTRIFSETGVLVLLGIAVGLPASWLATRAIRGLLFDVGSSDPVTYAGVLAVLAAVAVLAGYVPARRATRIDPAIALRPR
jgi:putative ABC transport system permease protein